MVADSRPAPTDNAPPISAVSTLTLADLRTGDVVRLLEVQSLDAQVALLQMGVAPGATLTLTNRAPQGCPVAFHVHGTKIALRRAVAQQIRVERLNG